MCTVVLLTFMRLFEQYCTVGGTLFKIQHLYLQLDNCVGENKNNILTAYLAILVWKDIIETVEIHFMMGHTHIKIDQIFSRWVTVYLFVFACRKNCPSRPFSHQITSSSPALPTTIM